MKVWETWEGGLKKEEGEGARERRREEEKETSSCALRFFSFQGPFLFFLCPKSFLVETTEKLRSVAYQGSYVHLRKQRLDLFTLSSPILPAGPVVRPLPPDFGSPNQKKQ